MDGNGRGSGQHKRFSDLRAKLAALEYHDPFTADSLVLVDRLFFDLVTTTESYEDLQQREEQTAADLALSQAQLFPLKKENSRLLKENNALHLKVIKAAEDAGAAERKSLLQGKRAESEQEEARCLGAQKDLRIQELERKVEQLQESLSKVLEAGDEKRVGTAAGTLEQRRQKGALNGLRRELEVTNTLPPAPAAKGRARTVRGGRGQGRGGVAPGQTAGRLGGGEKRTRGEGRRDARATDAAPREGEEWWKDKTT